jgi:hypothetical protein
LRWAFVLFLFVGIASGSANADELILDESLTSVQSVGDFDVWSCKSAIQRDDSGLLDSAGEITTGQLYAFFKKQGIRSVDHITLSLDVDPAALRADYALDSIELSIENMKYSLGANSLKLPAYEMSALKPEGQISVKLGYDFMQQFNEESTEKLKFDFAMSRGAESADASILSIAVMPQNATSFSFARLFLLIGFSGFWVAVFLLLFRATAPKADSRDSHQGTSPA